MQEACTGLDFDAIRTSFLFYKTITSQYEDPRVLETVREIVPREVLEGEKLPSLLRWYKGFMTWIPNQIACSNCGTEAEPVFMQASIEKGNSWEVRKTEVHTCNRCGAQKVIPRYSDVLKIAETKHGRCGEWSILFGAILNSLSVRSRIAYDYLDHCWNEALLEGKWYHVDSTFQFPHSFDNPQFYERNWNKKYVYVIAFSGEAIEDVTQRYTEKWDVVLSRRKALGKFGNLDMRSISDLKDYYNSVPSLYVPQ
ncbi:MAG TPA: transglutaminase domain-containing protein [Candidatus Nitrosotalea sp.]|nr:transglutaminase domain-containing protein [Candidatus Nitrosotalea sp.]